MTTVIDDFDRASLGANWITPGNPSVGALQISSGQGTIQLAAVPTNGTALYNGSGEFSHNQWAEIEVGDAIHHGYGSTVPYYANMANLSPMLHGVDGSRKAVWAGIGAVYYNFTTNGPLSIWISQQDAAGANVAYTGVFYQMETFFPSSLDKIPVGARVRIESVDDVLYAFLWSPELGQWFKVIETPLHSSFAAVDGRPGIRILSVADNIDDAQISQFAAGQDADGSAYFSSPTEIAFTDYIPVVYVTGRTARWKTDESTGFIPVVTK